MLQPPLGITLPILYCGCAAGNQVAFHAAGSGDDQPFLVTLAGCDCRSMRDPDGHRVLAAAKRLMQAAPRPVLWLPLPDGHAGLIRLVGGDRPLIGEVFLDEYLSLTQELIACGLARRRITAEVQR